MANTAVATTSFTTIMLRNVPKKYTAWELVLDVERFAARSAFDFVYVPCDKSSVTNMSYAFVNFVEPGVAALACCHMDGAPRGACGGGALRGRSSRSEDQCRQKERGDANIAP